MNNSAVQVALALAAHKWLSATLLLTITFIFGAIPLVMASYRGRIAAKEERRGQKRSTNISSLGPSFCGGLLLALLVLRVIPNIWQLYQFRNEQISSGNASLASTIDSRTPFLRLSGATIVLGLVATMSLSILLRAKIIQGCGTKSGNGQSQSTVSNGIPGPVGVFGTYTSLKDTDSDQCKSNNSSISDSGRVRSKNLSGDSNMTLFDDDTTELDSSDEEMLMHWRNMRGAVQIQLLDDQDGQDGDVSKKRRGKRRRGSCCDSQCIFLLSLSILVGLKSFLDGCQVGSRPTPEQVWSVTLGVIAEQSVISLAMGTVVLETKKLSVLTACGLLLFFTFFGIAGVLVGSIEKGTLDDQIIPLVLRGVSAGATLHMTIFELIDRSQNRSIMLLGLSVGLLFAYV